ncbi:HNH endonuclease signature motif containing protein [Polynucleobacter antarcticus]|uniref:HNH endonuclease n=1 Tax=Polynucleobacter antarcticus TaxID=1743162 RepID=A0A6M9PKI0_9BURK|nr:HNH endonuclease signature motif containing protein [Polynucleobacter antarcticus]QKM62684.1 HNH endonuclease [Polynucleobacter antarcticus]
MKLPDFIESASLNSLRSRIKAPLSFYKLSIVLPAPQFKRRDPPPPPPVLIPVQGLDVDFGSISAYPDGTLIFDGRRVLIHIRDVADHGGRTHIPRFHISNCRTLIEMKSSGRFEKYVVAEAEDGNFYIRYNTGPLKITKLDVCQNCLENLAWDGFFNQMSKNSRSAIVSKFSPKRFFEKYPKSLHPVVPVYTSATAPINDYPENWDQISRELKRQLRYRCQQPGCGIELSEELKNFLHVHHKNALKNDCRPENLVCLCIGCHANQPNHSHIKSLPEYKTFVSKFQSSANF